MRPRLEYGPQPDRAHPRRSHYEKLPYEAPRMMEFDEDLRRRCAQVFEELGHLLHCLKCEDPEQHAQIEEPATRLGRFDPHYWG